MTNYDARFGGIKRLLGADAQSRLHRAHVCVIGVGGVGSWAVEALARTGVGRLTLVDLDDICISNVNRQLHALTGEFGKSKVAAMAARVRLISPDCEVHEHQALFTARTADDILAPTFDAVLDAIDTKMIKALLIAKCRAHTIPVVTTGGAGGRRDPLLVRVEDLAHTAHDGLLQNVRKLLRVKHGFPRGKHSRFGVPCVYSPEAKVYPAKDGAVCAVREPGTRQRLDCRSGYGTATFVTGTFGFVAASEVVKLIISGDQEMK